MLYAYRIQQGSLQQVEDPALHAECDWLDLVAPDEAERALVDVRFGEVLPTADDMEELEASSRYFTLFGCFICALCIDNLSFFYFLFSLS